MRNIAIIPARGGSKRIPRKNIRSFLGKPIIAYSIEKAIESGLFDRVLVSTDDEEIAKISTDYDAEVPFFRSEKNSSDYATTVDVLIEVLDKLHRDGEDYDYGCCIYPTAPLIKTSYLQLGFNQLLKNEFDTLFPVTEYSYPILRSLKLNEDNKIEMNWPEYESSRSQDLPVSYHDAGQFYWFASKYIKQEKTLFGKNAGALVIPQSVVQDIDNEIDWKIAELKARIIE